MDHLIHHKKVQVEIIQFFQQLHLLVVVLEEILLMVAVTVDLVEEVVIQLLLVDQEIHLLFLLLKETMVEMDILDYQVQDLLVAEVERVQRELMDHLMVLHQILVDQEEQDHQLQIYLELLHNLFTLFQDLVKDLFLVVVEEE